MLIELRKILSPELLGQLEGRAVRENVSIDTLIKQAVEQYFAKDLAYPLAPENVKDTSEGKTQSEYSAEY